MSPNEPQEPKIWTPSGMTRRDEPPPPPPDYFGSRLPKWMSSNTGLAVTVGPLMTGLGLLAVDDEAGWWFLLAAGVLVLLPPGLLYELTRAQRQARRRFVGSAALCAVLLFTLAAAYGPLAGALGIGLVLSGLLVRKD